MGSQAKPEEKFAMIREALSQPGNMLKVTVLCELAGVSRSGYYNWCANEIKRQQRDEADRKDFDLILAAYRFRGYDKGAEGICMRLLHQGIIMNVKKVRRLMRKFGLKCPIRQPNPYKQMARAIKTSTVAKNIVNREFDRGPRKVLLTDITYLFYNGHRDVCYLSTILDACTHEVLAYQLSETLKVDFVLETVEKLIKKHGATLDNETIVHSDQGVHYTSLAFIEKLKDAKFVQSMSRRGNCWDNAPQESFFGHMKDHIEARIAEMTEYSQVVAQVDDYIDYYNNDAGQMSLLKLTPCEYYKYLQTGKYPLPVWNKRTDGKNVDNTEPKG
jgi:transposase InsO family protein